MNALFTWLMLFFAGPFISATAPPPPESAACEETDRGDDPEKETRSNDSDDDGPVARYIFNPISNGF